MCVENAGRSQMAEDFFRKYSATNYEQALEPNQPVISILSQ
jgi:protein-tyrosine-phosphatase